MKLEPISCDLAFRPVSSSAAKSLEPLLNDKDRFFAWGREIDADVPVKTEDSVIVHGNIALNTGRFSFDSEKAAKHLSKSLLSEIKPLVPTQGAIAIDGLEFIVAAREAWEGWQETDEKGSLKPIFATARAGLELAEVATPFVPILQKVSPQLHVFGIVLKFGNALVQGIVKEKGAIP